MPVMTHETLKEHKHGPILAKFLAGRFLLGMEVMDHRRDCECDLCESHRSVGQIIETISKG